MPKLKMFKGLVLVFIRGELKIVYRKGKTYKVSDVQAFQDLKFNLGKHFLTLIDVKQLVEMNSPDISIEVDNDRIIIRNVNLI